jgi:hypothetical protein
MTMKPQRREMVLTPPVVLKPWLRKREARMVKVEKKT